MMDYYQLRTHIGHDIVCVRYGKNTNVSIECETCMEVILSIDISD